MPKRQAQQAGENSQQFQVSGNLFINQGITEERAFEIAREVSKVEMAALSDEADAIGSERIARFDTELVRQFVDLGSLGAFAEPAFQVLLRKAQIGAASSDRESDYDLLARLLSDRVTRGEARPIRAGIDRAVQVVDQLDEPALVGLTVLQAAMQFSPMSAAMSEGLDVLNRLFDQLMQSDLPEGLDWLDHLDVLGAVRVSQVGTLKKFSEYYPNHMTGYVSPGIEAGSEVESRTVETLATVSLVMPGIEHEFKPGFVRLPFPRLSALQEALDGPLVRPEEQKAIAIRVARDEYRIDEVDPTLVSMLMEELEKRESLCRLKQWWDQIPAGVQVTSVGRVLARANAKRCDTAKLLPELY